MRSGTIFSKQLFREEMPVVTNTSSRRRSTRVAAKKIAEVPAEEPIKEESAEEAGIN
jgi:hypothetical protein